MKPLSENDPIYHTIKIKAQMSRLINHLRGDVGKVTEPKAQALFETSAEVLTGLEGVGSVRHAASLFFS